MMDDKDLTEPSEVDLAAELKALKWSKRRPVSKRVKVFKVFQGICHWCKCRTRLSGHPAAPYFATRDHVWPRRMRHEGLQRQYTVLSCAACNVAKGDADPDQFAEQMSKHPPEAARAVVAKINSEAKRSRGADHQARNLSAMAEAVASEQAGESP